MQGKGLEGDCLEYATLAYAQLTAGKLAAATDMFNEMAKKQMFWVHAIERGLMGRVCAS
jgi:hypothetical protein